MLSTDPQSLELVVLSDFAEDSTPLQHTERLAKIKAGVEQGQSLVLVNAKPLQSSLYSLLNRHYSMAESVDTGKIEAYVQMGVRKIMSLIFCMTCVLDCSFLFFCCSLPLDFSCT